VVRSTFYQRPPVGRRALSRLPAVASWDRHDSPGQRRSADFIDDAYAVIAPRVGTTPDPLALRLDVGLPPTVPLEEFYDLDNYLLPLVPRLSGRTGRQFASVWATKRHADTSTITVERAAPARDPLGECSFDVTTTAGSTTDRYKQQICDQIPAGALLPAGPVALQIAFVVGPRRAWANLWKPTIDSMGKILGHDLGASAWNPRDGRIVDLALHCVIDPTVGNAVNIAVRASPFHREP
jgi:hypothetical protein